MLQTTDLHWTQVCPPAILDKPYNGRYTTKANYAPNQTGQVNAGNLAHFMIYELEKPQYLYNRVGIANE